VGLHHVDEGPLGAALDGGRGHHRGATLGVQEQAGVDELVGEQLSVGVREQRLEPHGAGARIDLVVDRQQGPRGEPPLLLAVVGLDRQAFPGLQLVEQPRQAVLGDREDHGDGLKLGDRHQPVRIGRANDVARVHQAQPDSTADRRGDAAVGQLELGHVDLSLVELDDAFVLVRQRLLGIELLLRDRILGPQPAVPLHIEPGVLEERLVAHHLSLGLGQLHLEGPRVDLGQQLAALDELALPEQDLHQLAVDAALDGDGVERRDGAEAVEVDGDVPLSRRHRHHRHAARGGRRGPSRARLGLAQLHHEHVRGNGQETDHEQRRPPAPEAGRPRRHPPGLRSGRLRLHGLLIGKRYKTGGAAGR